MRRQEVLTSPGPAPGMVRENHPEVPPPRDQILTTKVGLRFPADVSFDSWQQAGRQISHVVDSFAWCLGDWLVYGQRRYTNRYKQAIDAIGLDYQTLRNYASVARRVTLPRRRPSLSFQHHAEVAALSETEQDSWLHRAEQGGWSRNQLRQHLRGIRYGRSKETTALPKMVVQDERIARWRLAATQSNSQFEQWVITALDQAATSELGT
ncbi:LmbU family transcriptional regulator [Actinophytocola xinjiangensis]|uniref:LmbU family transcriptional regulator n=1 Tax=Actinophytocola xinjiangensis TaxID=485602 RepID=UPI001FE39F3D|nr:LmbU family transcriptional regulator [Actinophytocola xinjiangensis]